MRGVRRGQRNLGAIAARMDLIATAERHHAIFNPQFLLRHLEAQKMRRFYSSDVFLQMATYVDTANHGSGVHFIAFGSQRLRKNLAKKPRFLPWRFFVENQLAPNGFGAGVNSHPSNRRLLHRFARKESPNSSEMRTRISGP